jgi:hypothetical protein
MQSMRDLENPASRLRLGGPAKTAAPAEGHPARRLTALQRIAVESEHRSIVPWMHHADRNLAAAQLPDPQDDRWRRPGVRISFLTASEH